VVLAIAKLVHAKLSAMNGVEPMLTRDRDVLIPLKKRSQLAVAQEADLFLSIHANASRSRKAQGYETFFLGEARTELSRELAMRENSAVQYEEEGEGMSWPCARTAPSSTRKRAKGCDPRMCSSSWHSST
jgi:N-acetylmuramoyl-L-alanine amidase